MARITLQNVSVDFPVFGSHAGSLKRVLVASVTGGAISKETGVTMIHAIDDMTIELRSGDRLGITGHNGAGKSTLLRTMAGVYPPTKGRYRCEGRISSLIEPTLGIEPEFTGYENIALRGVIMGVAPREMEAITPAIAEFSELGEFLDMPVRTYSTGMLMRLAFSIATTVQSDILLMDEWLSVGDTEFQSKAADRMQEVVENAGILVLASHSMALIERECNRVIELQHGKVVRDEPIAQCQANGFAERAIP
jgi:lipopolysaccharide transport system ATP-binding protein